MTTGNDGFFTGYSARTPENLRPFLSFLAALVIAGGALVSFGLATHQGDAGAGGFDWDAGPQSVIGVLETQPYPVIHARPSKVFPSGHTYLLSGDGKRGVQSETHLFDGVLVEAGGFVVKRGTLDMLLVNSSDSLKRAGTVAAERPPAPVDLGRWRIQGEICDGKCYAGAMRPGIGLAHKACANLCVIGGVPPVLVTASPVAGASFFLLSDGEGKALDGRILDSVAVLIEAVGRIERRGDLHVFKLDPSTLKVARR